ncbi:MAG: hypothetical protein GY870_05845 [archaeon]|nr:hypothetical protein [archaeon]
MSSEKKDPYIQLIEKSDGKFKDFIYKYKIMSVSHFRELQEDINKVERVGKLSNNKVFRSYIEKKNLFLPENLPNAKSLIIIAIYNKLTKANFHYKGKMHEIMIAPPYYDDGLTNQDVEDIALNEIIKESGYNIERANIHLKLAAVRSGLGKYGRNNICYIDGMGSFFSLKGFFTDFDFKEDNWNELKYMDHCENCKICLKNCPTGSISEFSDVINIEKCIPLYNEIEGEFPSWSDSDAHNAMMGCMRCQLPCPGNSEVKKIIEWREDITEDEVNIILGENPDEKTIKSICNKTKMFEFSDAKDYLPVFTRNLRVLLKKD